jgi:hypothetical protein
MVLRKATWRIVVVEGQRYRRNTKALASDDKELSSA